MTDPLSVLGERLEEAARRLEPSEACDAPVRAVGHRRIADRLAPALRQRRRSRRARAVGLRLAVLGVAALLTTAAAGLASNAFILPGEPVRPERAQGPAAGAGFPTRGGSRLLPLLVPDPAGGPPWGIRVLRTTRAEVCLQVGRVQGGQIGALGVGGAFGDDGRFHPIPTSALPTHSLHGRALGSPHIASYSASCLPSGQALVANDPGVDISATATVPAGTPASDLRDVYYGILGPQAVSVTYDAHGHSTTVPVQRPTGSYLIVLPATKTAPSYRWAVVGLPGQLMPTAPLTAITYRLGGELCQRVVAIPRRHARAMLPLCQPSLSPLPEGSAGGPRGAVHASVEMSDGVIRGIAVHFRAPYAVAGARQAYVVGIRQHPCGASSASVGGGFVGQRLDRDVASGSDVTVWLPNPFGNPCSPSRTLRVSVIYTEAGRPPVSIGGAQVSDPAGTRRG